MTRSIGLGELFTTNAHPSGSSVSLGQVAAVIAQLDDEPPSPIDLLALIDSLASSAPGVSSASELMTFVFGRLGFRGNTTSYYDPANSYLHRVIDSRAGIPITLSIIAIEVGARLGISLVPVGMPAHFLIGSGPEGTDDARGPNWYDPMSGGRCLTRPDVEALFSSLIPDAPFEDRFLQPIESVEVAARMLNNLRAIHLRSGDLTRLCDVVGAQIQLPETPPAARLEFAQLLSGRGDYAAAVDQLELLSTIDPDQSERYSAASRRISANFN